MISIIAALNEKNVIGKDNKLPWHIPEDLQNFKMLTAGHTVVMGKNTYESTLAYLNKPLPNRNNIVVSRTLKDERVEICQSVNEAVELAKKYNKPIWILGGQRIYKDALSIADEMYLSHVHNTIEGDTYFPEYNVDDWKVVYKREYKKFTLKKYKRK